MEPNASAGLLQLISAAVTPVVMISACAGLILGVNNKHTSLSDRIRDAARECRLAITTPDRREQLLEQLAVFHRRFLLTWMSLCALYGATAAFTLTTLLIVFAQRKLAVAGSGTLPFFLLGVGLMLLATCLEVCEIALSTRGLHIEMRGLRDPSVPPDARRDNER